MNANTLVLAVAIVVTIGNLMAAELTSATSPGSAVKRLGPQSDNSRARASRIGSNTKDLEAVRRLPKLAASTTPQRSRTLADTTTPQRSRTLADTTTPQRSRTLADTVGGGAATGTTATSTSAGAEAYVVLYGGTAAAAAGYGIELQYLPTAAVGLAIALSSVLPSGLALITGSGLTTVTWNASAAAAAGSGAAAVLPPSLDGINSYLELRIPAPGLDVRNAFGCLSYNATSNSLRSASGNLLTGFPAAATASYDNATERVICRIASLGGSYVVAQGTAAALSTTTVTTTGSGSSGSVVPGSTGIKNTSPRGDVFANAGTAGRVGTEGLVVSAVVGGLMALPLTLLAVGLYVMRVRQRRELAAAAAAQLLPRDPRHPGWAASSSGPIPGPVAATPSGDPQPVRGASSRIFLA